MTGSISVQLSVAVSGVSVSGSVAIEIDTNPASPKLAVRGDDLNLTVFGQVITADVSFEQVTNAAGARVVRVGIADGSVRLGGSTPADAVVVVSGLTGLFVITPAGVAGRLAGQISLNVPQVEFAAAVSLAVNTTSAAVNQTLTVGGGQVPVQLPAGPYLRVEAIGVTLKVAGQSLKGNLLVEQLTTDALPARADNPATPEDDSAPAVPASQVVRIAVTGAELNIGDGNRTILKVTGGEALVVVLGTGATAKIAGRISGTVALVGVPGVTLTGTLGVEINNTGTAVRQAFTIGTTTTVLELKAGDTLRITGTNIVIGVAGVELTGNLVIKQVDHDASPTTPPQTRIEISKGSVSLGGELIKATNITGFLLINPGTTTPGSVSGNLSAGLQVTVPGIAIDGAATSGVDGRPGAAAEGTGRTT